MRGGSRAVAQVLAPTLRRTAARAGRRPALTLLGWHRVDGPRTDGLSTGVDDFRRHLDVLGAWGAQVLGLGEAVAALHDGTLPDRAVALTFDDGYASVAETAWPILRERSLPATLFAVSGFLAGELRPAWDRHEPGHLPDRPGDRLRMLRSHELRDVVTSGLTIGSHTRTHPWLPHLEPGALHEELAASKACLEEILQQPVGSLAYPSGGWTPEVRRVAGEVGYDVGVTVDRGRNTARTHPLSLRRAFAPESAADLRLLLDGAYTYLRPLDGWRNRRGPVW